MSRIGKKPVTVPTGVEVKIDSENVITVKGAKTTLTQQLHKDMKVNINGSELTVERPSDDKFHRSLHGLTRTLISNMVEGVTTG